jgi:chromosome partitioning protein
LGIEKKSLKSSVYTVMSGETEPKSAIIPTMVKNLDILPSNIDLAGAEVELVSVDDREKVLKGALNTLRNDYDYIFIDCPPSLGLLTVNALACADSILIPIQGEFFALEGLSQLLNTIKLAKKFLNPALALEGVVLTMYDGRSKLVQSVAEEIQKFFGNKVYNTKIPRNVRLGEAPSYGLPIALYEPRSLGSIAYKGITEEFFIRNKVKYDKINDISKLKAKVR